MHFKVWEIEKIVKFDSNNYKKEIWKYIADWKYASSENNKTVVSLNMHYVQTNRL